MTKNNFWASELQLLTTYWQNPLFFFYESDNLDVNDILLSQEQAQITVICLKRRWRKRGQGLDCLLRISRPSNKSPHPSILLANVKSLENKIHDLRGRLIQNCNILCFTESYLNDNIINIQMAG